MKVEVEKVVRLKLTDLTEYNLDPVSVYLEDVSKGKGKIVIECYCESWSSFWGGIGDRSVAQFFISCDNDYLINKLTSVSKHIVDESKLAESSKKQILKLRKHLDLDEDEARELWDFIEYSGLSENDNEIMHKIWGDEWWYSLPDKKNPDWEYLDRIVSAVKDAIKSIKT